MSSNGIFCNHRILSTKSLSIRLYEDTKITVEHKWYLLWKSLPLSYDHTHESKANACQTLMESDKIQQTNSHTGNNNDKLHDGRSNLDIGYYFKGERTLLSLFLTINSLVQDSVSEFQITYLYMLWNSATLSCALAAKVGQHYSTTCSTFLVWFITNWLFLHFIILIILFNNTFLMSMHQQPSLHSALVF